MAMLKPLTKKSPKMVLRAHQDRCLDMGSDPGKMSRTGKESAARLIQRTYRLYRKKLPGQSKSNHYFTTGEDPLEHTRMKSGAPIRLLGATAALAIPVKAVVDSDDRNPVLKGEGLLPTSSAAEKRQSEDEDLTMATNTTAEIQRAKLPNALLCEGVSEASATQNLSKITSTKRSLLSDVKLRQSSSTSGAHEDDDMVNIMDYDWLVSDIQSRVLRQKKESTAIRNLCGWLVSDLYFASSLLSKRDLLHKIHSEVDERAVITSATSAQDTIGDPASANRAAKMILKRMRAKIRSLFVRGLGWSLSKVWRVLFTEVHVDYGALINVRKILTELDKTTAVVILPTHKSHLDYLMMSYVNCAYGLPLPVIAAGDNLNMPIVGSILKRAGSFFMRRSFKGDTLYREVLRAYVRELLLKGNTLEFFIEGGRSRHGRLCKPKLGLLSMIAGMISSPDGPSGVVESHEPTELSDVLLLPVSIDYDCVLESSGYAHQSLGGQKKKESLWLVIRSIFELFFTSCGRATVRYGRPLSLKQALQKRDSGGNEASSLEGLAEEVAVAMQDAAVIPATALVSTVLLSLRSISAQIPVREMEESVNVLFPLIAQRGIKVASYKSAKALVGQGLRVLSQGAGLVLLSSAENGEEMASFRSHSATAMIKLSYYRNQLMYPLLPHIAIAAGFQACTRSAGRSRISLEELAKNIIFANQLLLCICEHPQWDIDSSLQQLVDLDMLRYSTFSSSGKPESIVIGSNVRLMQVLCGCIWPYMDAYWAVATALLMMLEMESVASHQMLLSFCQSVLHDMYEHSYFAQFGESISLESLKPAVELLLSMGAIEKSWSAEGDQVYTLRWNEDEILQLRDHIRKFCQRRRVVSSFGDESTTGAKFSDTLCLMSVLNPRKPLTHYQAAAMRLASTW